MFSLKQDYVVSILSVDLISCYYVAIWGNVSLVKTVVIPLSSGCVKVYISIQRIENGALLLADSKSANVVRVLSILAEEAVFLKKVAYRIF